MRLQRRAVDQHAVRLFDAKGGPVEAKRAARARLLAYPHPRSWSWSSCRRRELLLCAWPAWETREEKK